MGFWGFGVLNDFSESASASQTWRVSKSAGELAKDGCVPLSVFLESNPSVGWRSGIRFS